MCKKHDCSCIITFSSLFAPVLTWINKLKIKQKNEMVRGNDLVSWKDQSDISSLEMMEISYYLLKKTQWSLV